jgi:hypothetical protein
MSVFERERSSIAAHRATMQGSSLPPPKRAARGSFLHGFFLPFSLIVATIRDRELRGPYLRLALLRGLLLVLVGVFAIANGNISSARRPKGPSGGIVIHSSKHHATDAEKAEAEKDEARAERRDAKKGKQTKPVHLDVPGLHVDIDPEQDKAEVSVLGQNVPVTKDDGAAEKDEDEDEAAVEPPAAPKPPPTLAGRMWNTVSVSWAWLLTLIAFLSAIEGIIVFFSRRWDDWISFHASRLAKIRPEDAEPTPPKIAFDLKWLYRKVRRRIRGYVVFAAGLPALLPLRLLPTVGPWVFTIAATLWGWYWLGVFSAAKSAHAWADEGSAPSPLPIRALSQRVSQGWFIAPLRLYARVWARITNGVNPAAQTFERSPAAFLGLALARALLSLPGLYLLARPIVPVAAGRLCAEGDPEDRFSAAPLERPQPERVAPCAPRAPSL